MRQRQKLRGRRDRKNSNEWSSVGDVYLFNSNIAPWLSAKDRPENEIEQQKGKGGVPLERPGVMQQQRELRDAMKQEWAQRQALSELAKE